VVITRKPRVVAEYLSYLQREIDLIATHLPHRRRVSQLHWGGGTPTYLNLAQMEALQRKITQHFTIEPDAEVAVEVDPRVTSRAQLRLLSRLGFNRISIGVQDFTPEVQSAVNRNQTEAETRELYGYCRELDFGSINLDLIYGLPLQNPGTFARSIETVLDLRPDRVAIYSYAFVPWLKAHQKRMDADALPTARVKLHLFSIARSALLSAGYVQIGMDHFALPDDDLVAAMNRGKLQRNFMGYTVTMGSDMIGAGTSAIGDVRGALAQNAKKLSGYYQALDAGEFPIERGRERDEDDKIRRDVIMQLMCNFVLDRKAVEDRFGIDFGRYFADELAELRAPDGAVQHGFLRIRPDRLEVVGHGRLFVRNMCMVFDRYLRTERSAAPVFSRTV
jgi:oxygen-independent coproporphyrinogen-3 oxidase